MEINIEKFNEIYLRIQCEPSIAKELHEFFSFEVPNARYMRAVQNRIWSGRVHLFSPATGKIYLGLYPYVKRFCEKQGYRIKVWGPIEAENGIDKELVRVFVSRLNTGIKARPYQINAIHHIINTNRGLILSPTGSGKSLIIYALTRYYVDMFSDKKVLCIVPTTSLVEQLYNDFADYGWFPDEHCHKLYSGNLKHTPKEVVISTWQSIYRMPKSYFKQFGAVFVDEAHLAKAKSLTGIMNKMHDCKYRIGTTGTLDGTEVHRLILEGLFSVHEQGTTTSQLIEDKQLSNLHIYCLVMEHMKHQRIRREYQAEIDFLSQYEPRNEFIFKLANTEEGNTLILCRYIVQLQRLQEMLKASDRDVYLVYGKTPTEDRELVRGYVEKGKNAIILASYGVFSTGINIKRLHNIIFASPYRSQIKVLQSIGRGLRVADDKDELKIFDIADDMSTPRGKPNYTLKHLKERIEIYNSQGFDYDIVPVKLKEHK